MLFDYQHKAVSDTRAAFLNHRRVILTMPTGSGKTYTAATMVKAAAEKGRSLMWVAHRNELLDQARSSLANVGAPPEICTSIQKWNRSGGRIKRPDFIVIDEAHLSIAETYKKLIQAYPKAYVLGLTATPYRLDAQGLGEIYDTIVEGPATQHLIDIGRLAPPMYRVPSQLNFAELRKAGRDFDPRQMAAMWDKAKVFAGVVRNFTQMCPEAKAIAFSSSVEQSQKLVNEFAAAGYIAAHVDAETPPKERARLLDLFRKGQIQILCNVALFTEGYDLPDIQCVILNRATLSRALYMQMVGRGGRSAPGKTGFWVLDFGGNVLRHGRWESPVEFNLDGTPPAPSEGVAPMKVCKSCFIINPIQAKVCTACGWAFPTHTGNAEETELVSLDDRPSVLEFVEICNSATAQMRPEAAAHRLASVAQNPAEYRKALQQLAAMRGYSAGWVWRTQKNIPWKGSAKIINE
jgi:superfamily II DNA or RNA helicase